MMKTALRPALGLAVVMILAACGGGGGGEEAASTSAAPEPAAPAPAGGGSGTIAGSVSYTGEDSDATISMDADPVCAGLHEGEVHTEAVVAADGNLANTFVWVKEGVSGSYPAPSESAVLDQLACNYEPHVSGIQVGQNLIIRNSDPTLHNVHAIPQANAEFNQGQPFQGMEIEKAFETAEVMIPFKCDVHPWMASYLAVVDHPFFAVSGEDGSFSISGLPAGDYVVEAWHETLGTREQSVTVGDGEVAISFDFSS